MRVLSHKKQQNEKTSDKVLTPISKSFIIDVENIKKNTPNLIDAYQLGSNAVAAIVGSDGKRVYRVFEPELIEEEGEKQLFEQFKSLLKSTLDSSDSLEFLLKERTPEEREKHLRRATIEIIKKYRMKIKKSSFEKVMYHLCNNNVYLGKISALMRDPKIEDISYSGAGTRVYIHHKDGEFPTNIYFSDEEVDMLALRMAYLSGKHISIATPTISGQLPDGSRVQLSYGSEVTRKGSTFTIRKFGKRHLTIVDLLSNKTIMPEAVSMLWYALEHKKSVLICGPTASGKTTTLGAMSIFIPPNKKIVTIEDTPELSLPHENWTPCVTRTAFGGVGAITMADLLWDALRMRPDYLIVGEVRGSEAQVLFQAIATGHGGLTTFHAEDTLSALHRLIEKPLEVASPMIPLVNYMMFQGPLAVGGKEQRRTKEITEILDYDSHRGKFVTNTVYKYNPLTDSLAYIGRSMTMEHISKQYGIPLRAIEEELSRRKEFLNWMVEKNIREPNEISEWVTKYYSDPEYVYKKIRLIVADSRTGSGDKDNGYVK